MCVRAVALLPSSWVHDPMVEKCMKRQACDRKGRNIGCERGTNGVHRLSARNVRRVAVVMSSFFEPQNFENSNTTWRYEDVIMTLRYLLLPFYSAEAQNELHASMHAFLFVVIRRHS